MAKGTLTYTLRRIVFGDTFTGGELINPFNKRIAYTIEDTDRGLDVGTSASTISHVKSQYPKLTAINAGIWNIEFTRNTTISSINYIDGGMGVGVVPVLNGNGWGGIRFHGGGSSRASAGCIILGTQLPNSDHIPSSKAVIESVNKEMVYYHLQGYNLQINIIRAKGAKLSSAANALGAFVGDNIDDMSGGSMGGTHDWPDFNVQSFPIMSDARGNYTSEPLLLGVANHLRMEGGGTGTGTGDINIVGGGTLDLLSVNGLSQLIQWEGWSGGSRETALTQPAVAKHASFDRAGVITVGPGVTNLSAPEIVEGQSYTYQQIAKMFSREIISICNYIKSKYSNVTNLGQQVIDMAISLAYNAGKGKLSLLNGVTTKEAAANAFRNGPKTAAGKVLAGLVKRRNAEADIVLGVHNENTKYYWNPTPLAQAMAQSLK